MRNKVFKCLAVSTLSMVCCTTVLADTTGIRRTGKFNEVIATGNNTYVYSGYTKESINSVYQFNGDTDEILQSGSSSLKKFSNKYVEVDGSLIDMESGESTSESSLKKSLKKKVYKELEDNDMCNVEDEDDVEDLKTIDSYKLSNKWYTFSVPSSDDDADIDEVFGIVNDKGTVLNLSSKFEGYVVNEEGDDSIKIENFDEEEDGYTAILNDIELVGTCDSYVYLLATVQVKSENTDEEYEYIMKVSESKSSDNEPSKVTSYLVDENLIDDKKVEKAYKTLKDKPRLIISGDDLYALTGSSKNIELAELSLSKDDIEIDDSGEDVELNVVLQEDSISESVTDYCISKSDELWTLKDGKVYLFNANDFVEKGTVGKDFTRLDVYDDNNIIVFNNSTLLLSSGGKIYNNNTDNVYGVETNESIISNSSKDRWVMLDSGEWNYYDSKGTLVKNKWIKSNGDWYFLKSDGLMVKDSWVKSNGKWYRLGYDGKMETNWSKQDSSWYYLGSDGAMRTGWQKVGIKWYYLQDNGVMMTGWIKLDGRFYYLYSDGHMASNETIDGFRLKADGSYVE